MCDPDLLWEGPLGLQNPAAGHQVIRSGDIRSGANCSVKPEAGFFPVEMSATAPFYLGCLLLWGKDCALQPGLDVHFTEPGTERSQGPSSAWI